MLWRWQPNVTDKKLGRHRRIRELDPEVGLARKKKEHAQREQDRYGPALGQGGSSTRQELMGWIDILTQPFRSHYATDSAAMLNKANQMLEKGKTKRRRSKPEGQTS